MKDRIEFGASGIVCDNEKCDFKDDNVPVEQYQDWLNKPCPNCGENLLTEEDYNNALQLAGVAKMINSLSDEELKAVFGELADQFKWDDEPRVEVSFNTHKGISIKDIKPVS